MKSFSGRELADSDGKGGRRTLVAVDGRVYDLTASKKWAGGVHMNRHHAGNDLTNDIRSAPHGLEVIARYEAVGVLEEIARPSPDGVRGRIESWLDRHPFFRRHPHPAIVHFPVGLLLSVPIFEIVAMGSNSAATEWAAYCCLMLGVLSIPAAMVTGYFAWWINYEAVDSPVIRKKRHLAWTGLALGVLSLIIRSFLLPEPTRLTDPLVMAYISIVIVLGALVGYVGFLGGKLTIPYE